jgi:(E)-4-hydroxy-3-methylbut-2-enyl-diphosphate synthase
MGVVFSQGKPLRKVATGELVDVLFEEIDKYYAAGKRVIIDDVRAAEGAALLAQIEAESAGELTPERLAAMERDAALQESAPPAIDEAASPVDGRRFQRA